MIWSSLIQDNREEWFVLPQTSFISNNIPSSYLDVWVVGDVYAIPQSTRDYIFAQQSYLKLTPDLLIYNNTDRYSLVYNESSIVNPQLYKIFSFKKTKSDRLYKANENNVYGTEFLDYLQFSGDLYPTISYETTDINFNCFLTFTPINDSGYWSNFMDCIFTYSGISGIYTSTYELSDQEYSKIADLGLYAKVKHDATITNPNLTGTLNLYIQEQAIFQNQFYCTTGFWYSSLDTNYNISSIHATSTSLIYTPQGIHNKMSFVVTSDIKYNVLFTSAYIPIIDLLPSSFDNICSHYNQQYYQILQEATQTAEIKQINLLEPFRKFRINNVECNSRLLTSDNNIMYPATAGMFRDLLNCWSLQDPYSIVRKNIDTYFMNIYNSRHSYGGDYDKLFPYYSHTNMWSGVIAVDLIIGSTFYNMFYDRLSHPFALYGGILFEDLTTQDELSVVQGKRSNLYHICTYSYNDIIPIEPTRSEVIWKTPIRLNSDLLYCNNIELTISNTEYSKANAFPFTLYSTTSLPYQDNWYWHPGKVDAMETMPFSYELGSWVNALLMADNALIFDYGVRYGISSTYVFNVVQGINRKPWRTLSGLNRHLALSPKGTSWDFYIFHSYSSDNPYMIQQGYSLRFSQPHIFIGSDYNCFGVTRQTITQFNTIVSIYPVNNDIIKNNKFCTVYGTRYSIEGQNFENIDRAVCVYDISLRHDILYYVTSNYIYKINPYNGYSERGIYNIIGTSVIYEHFDKLILNSSDLKVYGMYGSSYAYMANSYYTTGTDGQVLNIDFYATTSTSITPYGQFTAIHTNSIMDLLSPVCVISHTSNYSSLRNDGIESAKNIPFYSSFLHIDYSGKVQRYDIDYTGNYHTEYSSSLYWLSSTIAGNYSDDMWTHIGTDCFVWLSGGTYNPYNSSFTPYLDFSSQIEGISYQYKIQITGLPREHIL